MPTSEDLYLVTDWSFTYCQVKPVNMGMPDRTLCPLKRTDTFKRMKNQIHWNICRAMEGVILLNGSYGTVWDWSPKGKPIPVCMGHQPLCSVNELLSWMVSSQSGQQKIIIKAKSPISWKDSGLVPPYPQFDNSKSQIDLWKITLNFKNTQTGMEIILIKSQKGKSINLLLLIVLLPMSTILV